MTFTFALYMFILLIVPGLWATNALNLELVEKESATYKQKGKIIIIGGINGRTGEETDLKYSRIRIRSFVFKSRIRNWKL